MAMTLTKIEGEVGQAIAKLRDEVSEQLLGGDTSRPFAFRPFIDPPPHDPLAWTDPTTGELGLSELAIAHPEDPAVVAAIAHQVIHAIGYGPAFQRFEDQLLEEAITEALAQIYLADFLTAFGAELEQPAELFAGIDGDIEVTRPTAANVALERFARVAIWLEELDGTDDPQDLEAAVLKWAARLKATPGDVRFSIMAIEAAALGGDDDDVGAVDYLEEYLRGYLSQTGRSTAGFSALELALGKAWADDELPELAQLAQNDAAPWRAELAELERVLLSSLPPPGALGKALRAAAGTELAPAVERTLDARGFMWSARALAAAESDQQVDQAAT